MEILTLAKILLSCKSNAEENIDRFVSANNYSLKRLKANENQERHTVGDLPSVQVSCTLCLRFHIHGSCSIPFPKNRNNSTALEACSILSSHERNSRFLIKFFYCSKQILVEEKMMYKI